jgi:energy-coupling factor transport system ATP-binding protein
VVIAGALALDPKVLILDEPTAGLDPAACRELIDVLKGLREQGLTILVSTHDLDLFFPLADQVIVIDQGRLYFDGKATELVANPDILQKAGLELPAATRIAHRLRKNGIKVEIPVGVEGLLEQLKGQHIEGRDTESHPSSQKGKSVLEDVADSEGDIQHGSPVRETKSVPWDWSLLQTNGTVVHRLDPRMKWLGMVVLSFAFLQISHGGGVVAAVVLLAALMKTADLTWRKTVAYLRPFFVMFLFLWLVSAVSFGGGDIGLGPIGLSYEGAVQGGLGVIRFLLVIALGLVFTETTTGAPLREGFEWGIRPLRKVKVPTRDVSLAVSIVLQFVPWILEKVMQLRKALASRGQDTVGLLKWTPGRIVRLIAPLLILVIKMGDELATAIESRGYDRNVERTSWYQLHWKRKDTAASLLVIMIAGGFWWLG